MHEPRNILVVDDEEINRLIATLFLQKEGWQVDQAGSSQEALARLTAQRYRCILLDISMPGMSGLELCNTIHAHPEWQSTRLVAYTAHTLPDEQAAILKGGFDAIATKPTTREKLLRAVEKDDSKA